MIEVLVAVGVFAVVGSFMSHLLGAGFKGVLLGKRREVATQEANRLIEIARSLTYDAVGLIQTDATIASDDAIETRDAKPSYLSDTTWEPIIWATNPSGHPFNPHTFDVMRSTTGLTDYVYITGVDSDDDGDIDLKRVSVRVVWSTAGTQGPKNEVRAQTLVGDGFIVPPDTDGCVGDCNPNLTPLKANTLATGGSLAIGSSLLGLSTPLSMGLPTTTGNSTFRAVSDATCTAKSATLQSGEAISLDGYSVSVTADDDARTATPSDPEPKTSSGILTMPAGPALNLLGGTINSPIACDAAALPLPTETGSASALSALNANTTVTALGGLLNWALTIASVNTAPITQTITNEVVAGTREAAASASGSVGVVQMLKIPSLFSNGLVQVDALSYAASVRASGQTPSVAPSVTAPNFTVRVFDNGNKLGVSCNGISGAGLSASRSGSYCNVTVNPSASGYAGGSISVSHTFTELVGVDLVTIVYSSTIDLLPPSKSTVDGVEGSNGERRWSADYTPIVISGSLDASVLGAPIVDTDVDLNLGGAKAEGCAGATCL